MDLLADDCPRQTTYHHERDSLRYRRRFDSNWTTFDVVSQVFLGGNSWQPAKHLEPPNQHTPADRHGISGPSCNVFAKYAAVLAAAAFAGFAVAAHAAIAAAVTATRVATRSELVASRRRDEGDR